MATRQLEEPLTRAQTGAHLDNIRMCAAEIARYSHEIQSLVAQIDASSAILCRGLLQEMPPDIEIQPRIVRSA